MMGEGKAPRGAPVLRAGNLDVKKFRMPELSPGDSPALPCLESQKAGAGFSALERARGEGFAAGLAASQEPPEGAAGVERAELEAHLALTAELMQDFDQRLTMFVVAMSLHLSRLILRGAARIKLDQVTPAVREAVSRLPGLTARTRLHMHPADAALIREVTGTDGHAPLHWEIVEDTTLCRGECRLLDPALGEQQASESPWRQPIDVLARRVDWIDTSASDGRDVAS
jgi:flagellar assembly protein FliH